MYMLISMDFIMLGKLCMCWFLLDFFWIPANYVYADSNGFYNACKLGICLFYWVLNACKLCALIQLGFGILVNTVYVDPTWFLNGYKLWICCFY